MKQLQKSLLPALITAVLASPAALAQDDECIEIEGTPPGLYTTTEEGRTFLIREGEVVEMGPGDAGFADENQIACIRKPPEFLDWPCSTQAAKSRMFNTYSLEDLSSDNKLKEIVDRYFEIPEVLSPIPSWLDSEVHGTFNYQDLIQFSSPEYWYHPNADVPILSGKRPPALLVSLFVGTNQVVLDNNVIDALRNELGSDEIPVVFLFNDSNSVPISYFGSNVSLEEVVKAFNERGIKVSDVPMWWQGDHHLSPTIEEFEKFFDIPALEDIPAERQAEIRRELETNGFTRKSMIVTLFAGTGAMAVDQPQRVRVAASMGFDRIPTAFSFIESDSLVARCGPGTPAGGGAVSGASTPIGGAIVPPGGVVPPPVEPPASGS